MAGSCERLRRFLMLNYSTLFALVTVSCIFLMAILAPFVAPYDPIHQNYHAVLKGPSLSHLFGTDELGRDIFSRVVYGARASLFVSLSSMLIGMVLGVAIGLLSGYFGGLTDFLAMRGIDVLLSFPGILLAIMVAAVLGVGVFPVILAIAIWSIPAFARITRSSVLTVKKFEFVIAAKALGVSTPVIIIKHVLRNILGPILVYATLRMGSAVLSTAYLSFLGVGFSPPTPEWGLMLNSGRVYMREAPYIMFFPGMAIFISVLSFNLLGDSIRDFLDVKL